VAVFMTSCALVKPKCGAMFYGVLPIIDIASRMKPHEPVSKKIIALFMFIFEPYHFHKIERPIALES
jgi:hypothetical protein